MTLCAAGDDPMAAAARRGAAPPGALPRCLGRSRGGGTNVGRGAATRWPSPEAPRVVSPPPSPATSGRGLANPITVAARVVGAAIAVGAAGGADADAAETGALARPARRAGRALAAAAG